MGKILPQRTQRSQRQGSKGKEPGKGESAKRRRKIASKRRFLNHGHHCNHWHWTRGLGLCFVGSMKEHKNENRDGEAVMPGAWCVGEYPEESSTRESSKDQAPSTGESSKDQAPTSREIPTSKLQEEEGAEEQPQSSPAVDEPQEMTETPSSQAS